ncbi:hypothetical protein TNCV_3204381 [Trichonephila clavipes]|nr:hypothetical protein TNCV_3204381 [Trichonephila clavipes]
MHVLSAKVENPHVEMVWNFRERGFTSRYRGSKLRSPSDPARGPRPDFGGGGSPNILRYATASRSFQVRRVNKIKSNSYNRSLNSKHATP